VNSKIRTIGRIAAVGAVALVLAGSAASVEARTRSDAVRIANRVISSCFVSGGEPDAGDIGYGISFTCAYPDGTVDDDVIYYD